MQHYAAVIDITAAPAPAPPEEERETCYQRWIAACLRAGEQERVVSERDQAWVFCQWLEGAGEGKALEGIPVPVVEAVVAANPQTLRERLRDALRQQIPAILVPHLADSLQRHAAALTLCQGIQAGFDERELAEALYLAYAERGGRRPPWRERRAVAWVVERTGTLPLQALLQCWTRQWKRLRHCLAMLDEAAYRGFIHLALTSAQARADQLVVGGRGESLLDLYLNDSRAGEEPLIALVGALLAHGEAACLARLVPLARRRPRQEVRTLLRIIHRQPGVPEAFRSALEQTLTAASGRRRGS